MAWKRRWRRARTILRERGFRALVTTGFRWYVLDHREFFLFERQHEPLPQGSFRPTLDQFEEHFVSSNQQADELTESHDDFRRLSHGSRNALDAGATAFCIYVGRDVAHYAWVAATLEARRTLDRLGFEVPFDQGVAWTGAAWSNPPYRGKGLVKYASYRRFEYLRQLGFTASRGAVERRNRASLRANVHFMPRVYGVGIYWRVFRRRYWRERALRPGEFTT